MHQRRLPSSAIPSYCPDWSRRDNKTHSLSTCSGLARIIVCPTCPPPPGMVPGKLQRPICTHVYGSGQGSTCTWSGFPVPPTPQNLYGDMPAGGECIECRIQSGNGPSKKCSALFAIHSSMMQTLISPPNLISPRNIRAHAPISASRCPW